jgi:mxaL protein
VKEAFTKLLDADGRAILLALVLLLIALFLRPIPLTHDTYESLVIFDITQSMDVEDYEQGITPISRLKFAREAAKRALRGLPHVDPVGPGGSVRKLRRPPHLSRQGRRRDALGKRQ